MKKILFFIFIAIGLFFLIFYSYKYIKSIFLGDIVTKSEIKDFQLRKSDEFDEFNDFLYERGFWDTNGSSTETGRGRITPSKLTITITNTAQNGGFLKKSLNDINFYSSYRFETKDNKVNLILHIDPNICKLPECDVEDVTNKQILRAIYGITRTDNTPTTGEDYSNLYQKYSKKYFTLDSKLLTKVNNFISYFKIISIAHAGCDWFCAAESCSGYPIQCSYGPSGFTDASSGTDCSASCPSGYQAQNIRCSGCGSTPPTGGGGAYQYPTCGGGRVVKCGSPGLYAWDGGTFAHCRNRAYCGNTYGAASLFTMNGCDGVETKGSCQINCSCCNPSDNYVKTTTTGGTYEISNSCHNPTRCSDWDDTYISNRPAPATVANRCYQGCNNCGTDEEDVFWVYNVITTCRTVTTTWACQPTCTPASPSQPQLLTPTNGASVSTTSLNLTWNPSLTSWGTSCTTTNRTFEIYAGPVGSTMALIGTVNSTTGTVPFSGAAGPTYQWKVRASNGQGFMDSDTWTFTINPGPWWQAKDADLTTNGSISSTVPSGQLFDTVGLGGFPGVPVYGSTLNVGSGQISGASFNWNANTTTIQPRLFNYLYFDNLIPESVRSLMTVATDTSLRSTGFTYQGYEWFKSDGSLTIASNIDFGTRKVILFIENGGLGINGKINVDNGFGFFGAFVEGNIVVDPAVTGAPSIEGVYLTDLGFSSSISTLPLHVRGSIVSHGGVSLSRSLTNNTNPAELFEYAPDQILLFPDNLRYKRTKWAEIAP